jgi:hypothetical protein
MIVSNLILLTSGKAIYIATMSAQFAFYLIAAVSASMPPRPSSSKFMRLAAMFTVMNAALLVGFIRWMFGNQSAAWRRTVRAEKIEGVQS